MKTIYAINDRVAKELIGRDMYSLMTFRTPQQAARYFADIVNDKTSLLNKHPGDYELVELGTVTDEGIITPSTPSIIITGDALLALQEEEPPHVEQPTERRPAKLA